jgi:RNA polymerase sigma-70 factor, ECF subfamily
MSSALPGGLYQVMDSNEFDRLTAPFRGELLAYCYRMLGSVHDAEDLVQETYLRAWRSYGGFEGRSSLRTWLYKIATSACLTALDSRARRPMPAGVGGPSAEPERPLGPAEPGVPWLEPIPDALLAASPGDPATIVASRDSIRLAFVAALQYLPARQRAALILRDVLAWRSAEVADLLGTTVASVNSALQRARTQIAEAAPTEDALAEPGGRVRRALLDRYVDAFENADVAALVELLRDDVEVEMPPHPTWFRGLDTFVRFLETQCLVDRGAFHAVPTSANGQPAVAVYEFGAAQALHVLSVAGDRISRIVAFLDPQVFVTFALPAMTCARPAGLPRYDENKSWLDTRPGVVGSVPSRP